METRKYFEKVMQDYNQNRKGRNLRRYCLDEGIDYKWLSEYKKTYSASKDSTQNECETREQQFIALQLVDDNNEASRQKPDNKWKVRHLVIESPSGDEVELKCNNMSVVIDLLTKMSS